MKTRNTVLILAWLIQTRFVLSEVETTSTSVGSSSTSTAQVIVTSLKGVINFGPHSFYKEKIVFEDGDKKNRYFFTVVHLKFRNEVDNKIKGGGVIIHAQESYFDFKEDDADKLLLDKTEKISFENLKPDIASAIDVNVESENVTSDILYMGQTELVFELKLKDDLKAQAKVSGFSLTSPNDVKNGSPTQFPYKVVMESDGDIWVKIDNHFSDQIFCDNNPHIDDNREKNPWTEPWVIVIYIIAIVVVMSLLALLLCVGMKDEAAI